MGELVRGRIAALETVLQIVPLVSDPDKVAPRNGRAIAPDPENGEKAAPVSGFEIVREVGQTPADRWAGTVLAGETLAGTARQGRLPLGSDHSAAGQVILAVAARW